MIDIEEVLNDLEADRHDMPYDVYSEIFDTICLLGDERDRLRRLLEDVAICACGRYCHGCPHQYDGCDRDERLRELGIEVPE